MGLFKNLMKKAVGKEIEFKVAGVTFKNGRKTRQAILRAMKWQDPPYDKVQITLQRYDFEIGNVPKEIKDEVDAAWTKDYIVEEWKILGSGQDAPFGCLVKILFQR